MDPLQLLAEPRRRQILQLVWDRPVAVSDIAAAVDVSVAAVSQHLGKLRDAGMVTVTRDGKRRLYAADRHALANLAPLLEAMWRGELDRLAGAAETEQLRREGGR